MSADRYDWDAIRADYESGRVKSFADLSAKYGVTDQGIRDRRKADAAKGKPWVSPKTAHARSNNVIPFGRGRSRNQSSSSGSGSSSPTLGGELSDEEPVECEAENADPLAEQKTLGVMMQRAVRRALRRYMRGAIEPGMHQSEADVLNALISAGARAATVNRDIAGKGKGEASGIDGLSDEPVEIVIKSERITPADREQVVREAS